MLTCQHEASGRLCTFGGGFGKEEAASGREARRPVCRETGVQGAFIV